VIAARNLAKAWLLLVGFSLLLTALGWALGGYRVASLFLFCALLSAGGLIFYADRVALGMVGAKELPLALAPMVHSTVERLALIAGIPKPRLYLLNDPHPRALAAGRGTRGAAVAVSRGLLAVLSPAELEGVLAHELAKIHNRDVTVQTPLVVLSAMTVDLSRIGGWLERVLLLFLGPISAAFLHLMLSTKREFAADRTAAGFCGSPHGLADALIRLEQTEELFPFQSSPATEPLYTINPFQEEGLAALFVTHPPVSERVQRLRALDPNWREKLRAA
jgi:heat shock protein HtpX